MLVYNLELNMDDDKKCMILRYYNFLGKKWNYPIFFHLKKDKKYSFDDLIFITNRKISRPLLSNFLKDTINLSILEKKNKKYNLTNQGIVLKGEFLKTKNILLKNNDVPSNICNSQSLINKPRM